MTANPSTVEAGRAAELQSLFAAVEADPTAFDFFALLRRVDALRREHPRTGESQRPRQDALRLAQAAELDFAPAALHKFEWRAGGAPRLSVRFFGLLGPQGPMPLHFTEVVRDRLLHHADPTLAHFLDVFHHRLLSLFYRAWAQAQPVVHLDRAAEDRFRVWLAACSGAPLQPGALPADAMAFQAGWLTSRSRHPEMLVKVVKQFFGVTARVEEHVGHWLALDRGEQTRLGFARNTLERATITRAALGRSANVGTRVWDRQYRFRLHLGPLSHEQYVTFLPGGEAFRRLLHWVRLLAGREMPWDLELALRNEERPLPRLGKRPARALRPSRAAERVPRRRSASDGAGREGSQPRLGLSFWLGHDEQQPAGARTHALRLRPATSFLLHRAASTGATSHG
jgi:type VI secretion system protein ImpH